MECVADVQTDSGKSGAADLRRSHDEDGPFLCFLCLLYFSSLFLSNSSSETISLSSLGLMPSIG